MNDHLLQTLSVFKYPQSVNLVPHIALGISLGIDLQLILDHLLTVISNDQRTTEFSAEQINELLLHEQGRVQSKEAWGIPSDEHKLIAFGNYKEILEEYLPSTQFDPTISPTTKLYPPLRSQL